VFYGNCIWRQKQRLVEEEEEEEEKGVMGWGWRHC